MLCQTCSQLRYLCARLHLRKLGILNPGLAVTEIRLVGGPFSAQTVSLLRNVNPTPASHLDTPRMSIIIDLYHTTSFLYDVQLLLKTNAVCCFELAILDDEHSLLDNWNPSASLLNILSHLPPCCERLCFKAGPANSSRPALRQFWVPVFARKPGVSSIRKALASLTEVQLSLPLFHLCSLKNSTSILLRHSKVTSFSLICSTAIQAEDALSSTLIPTLEHLNVRVNNASLVTLPTTFMRAHSNLRHIYLSALFQWDGTAFLPHETRITLPSLASVTIPSKYAGFDIVDSSSLFHLHVYSFLAFPVPENRGYCEAVQSLVNIWLNSKTLEPASNFAASFTFPRRLSNHLVFCEGLPIYQCSCTPATFRGKVVHRVGQIKIFLDSVTEPVVVRFAFFVLSSKIIRNPLSIISLNGFAISRMCRSLQLLPSRFLQM